jgi:tetratricopeptide (TPR) repeat protein
LERPADSVLKEGGRIAVWKKFGGEKEESMHTKRLVICLGAMLFFLAAGFADAQDIGQYIAEGDAANNKFDNKKALELYEKALAEKPGDYEVLWRIAREYVNTGDLLPEDQQLAAYEKAKTYADKAVAANPKGSMGYTQVAVVLGKIALFKGVFQSIGLVKQVKEECDKAIELDPNNALAYFVLARTNQKVSEKPGFFRSLIGLGWASNEKAEELYRKAISLDSNSVMFNWYYAKLLAATGKYAESRSVLEKIPDMQITYQEDPEYKQDAQKLLTEIKNR